MAVTIDRTGPEDFPAVAALLVSQALPLVGLADHLATLLVARDESGIVGSTGLELYGTTALLRSVAVTAARQGQGLGRQLTTAALDLARAHGVREVYLLTETGQTFFPRLGFQPLPRAAVAPASQHSVEWTSACPVSAQAMVRCLESSRAPSFVQGGTYG